MTNPTCKSSTVEPRLDILIGEQVHAGIITHKCSLPEGHTELCLCGCGRQWRKFGDVK